MISPVLKEAGETKKRDRRIGEQGHSRRELVCVCVCVFVFLFFFCRSFQFFHKRTSYILPTISPIITYIYIYVFQISLHNISVFLGEGKKKNDKIGGNKTHGV